MRDIAVPKISYFDRYFPALATGIEIYTSLNYRILKPEYQGTEEREYLFLHFLDNLSYFYSGGIDLKKNGGRLGKINCTHQLCLWCLWHILSNLEAHCMRSRGNRCFQTSSKWSMRILFNKNLRWLFRKFFLNIFWQLQRTFIVWER